MAEPPTRTSIGKQALLAAFEPPTPSPVREAHKRCEAQATAPLVEADVEGGIARVPTFASDCVTAA